MSERYSAIVERLTDVANSQGQKKSSKDYRLMNCYLVILYCEMVQKTPKERYLEKFNMIWIWNSDLMSACCPALQDNHEHLKSRSEVRWLHVHWVDKEVTPRPLHCSTAATTSETWVSNLLVLSTSTSPSQVQYLGQCLDTYQSVMKKINFLRTWKLTKHLPTRTCWKVLTWGCSKLLHPIKNFSRLKFLMNPSKTLHLRLRN